ncbi:recombinase family protein [Anaerobacillus sp. HL2]|nr:recombinase family protein [Anaerobacillus sp. HL2]
MIEDCENNKIDYILTKSISRFARNTLDCISIIRKLKSLRPAIGVFFRKENIDTLNSKSELFLTILSSWHRRVRRE